MDDIDTGQVFPGNRVDFVDQFLYLSEPGNNDADNQKHQYQQRHYKARRNGGKRPALIDDFDDRPNRHDRRFDQDLKAHGYQHLYLGDIVCSTVNQTWDGKGHHFLLSKIRDFVKDALPDRGAESCRHLSGQKSADYTEYGAGQRAAQHFRTGLKDIGHGAVG